MTKKLPPEEELEKQYRDYKAQFEQWKEKNRGSEGTEGYINYVKQFEKWEKDVEARRANVRAKAEKERAALAAAAASTSTAHDIPVEHLSDAAQAARYAEQQKSYTAMHQRAIEQNHMFRQKQRPTGTPQPLMATMVPPRNSAPVQPQPQLQLDTVVHLKMETSYEGIKIEEDPIRRGPHIQADPQPTQVASQQSVQPASQPVEADRPPLWGPDGNDYLTTDPMFIKWGDRAMPPNVQRGYMPPAPDAPITPSWYLQQKMGDKGLYYGHNVNLCSQAEVMVACIPPPRPQIQQPPPQAAPPPLPMVPDFGHPGAMAAGPVVVQKPPERGHDWRSAAPVFVQFSGPPPQPEQPIVSIPPPIVSAPPPVVSMAPPPEPQNLPDFSRPPPGFPMQFQPPPVPTAVLH